MKISLIGVLKTFLLIAIINASILGQKIKSFNNENVINKLPEKMKNFLLFAPFEIPRDDFLIIRATFDAAQMISPFINFRQPVHIFYCSSDTCTIKANGTQIIVIQDSNVIAHTMKDMIFVNYKKSTRRDYEMQVVTILEEMVHAYMNVFDEKLVKHIVDFIDQDVIYINGQYFHSKN